MNKNIEGYPDPTAGDAMARIRKEWIEAKEYRPLIYICSPYAGDPSGNKKKAIRYCRFAVEKGYIPIAPHLLFPQFMDDKDPLEREMGLHFGKVLLGHCQEIWVFGETISEGMDQEIKKARWKNYRIKYFTSDLKEAEHV